MLIDVKILNHIFLECFRLIEKNRKLVKAHSFTERILFVLIILTGYYFCRLIVLYVVCTKQTMSESLASAL